MANVALTKHRMRARKALHTCATPNKPSTLGDEKDTVVAAVVAWLLLIALLAGI